MKLGILKKFCAASVAAALMFGISGCVSTSTTDGAKSLSKANSDYNIADYSEENVKIELETGMAFSEKGTVRFEGNGSMTNLIDFWEYGKEESDTVYFESPAVNLFNEYYYTNEVIEFAFEYKDMIYFLKRTFEKENYVYTLYRMNLKGDNITKVSSISLENSFDQVFYDDFNSCEYEITDVWVQNNNLIFSVNSYDIYYEDEYYDEILDEDYDEISDEDYEVDEAYHQNRNYEYVYKIDLTSGISNELLNTQYFLLLEIRCDSDFTYLYADSSSEEASEEVFKVYKIDNKTNKMEVTEYNCDNFNMQYYDFVDVYNDVIICQDDYSIDLISVKEKPKNIFSTAEFNSNISILNTWVIGNELIIQYQNEDTYKVFHNIYNLDTGELTESYNGDDINKAIYKLGDKYLCFIPDSDAYSGNYYDENCEYYYWSSVDDVLSNKHNFSKIKNQRELDSFSYPMLNDY